MSVASFEDLCSALCDLVGAAPPELEPGEDGMLSFTVNCEGVDIGFLQGESGGEPGALIVVDFGTAPEATELQVLREVLDSNFLLGGIGAPAFVRNPQSGEISLHQSVLLSQASAQEIYQLMGRAAKAVTRWKTNSLFETPAPQASHDGRIPNFG